MNDGSTSRYFETRYNTRRVFAVLSVVPTVEKSIERGLLRYQWGAVGSDQTQSMDVHYSSVKKAHDAMDATSQRWAGEGMTVYRDRDDPRLADERQRLFHSSLSTIASALQKDPSHARFNGPAEPLELELLEEEFDLSLPKAYHQFIARFNGGGWWNTQWDQMDESHFYSIARSQEAYHNMIFYKKNEDGLKALRAWPIGESINGEKLLLRSQSRQGDQSPVIFHDHETGMEKWGVLFLYFEDALFTYVEKGRDGSAFSAKTSPQFWKPSIL